jgi:ActR/RegA family two-component response regulator
VKAPTRALILEDIDSWVYVLSRAALRAGAAEVVVCSDLQMVEEALRLARFDLAILDLGLDPDDDVNADGAVALEMIRKKDGGSTRCVLVTGWQGGDRMDLMAAAQQKYGVDWAYMKENYEAQAVTAKLVDLLEDSAAHRLFPSAPMTHLGASMETFQFEAQLLDAISPSGGIRTINSIVSRLIGSVIPLVAMRPDSPMKTRPDGVVVGVYWSRALATPVAVGLMSTDSEAIDENNPMVDLSPFHGTDVTADLVERVRERNVLGLLWELSGLGRDIFAE